MLIIYVMLCIRKDIATTDYPAIACFTLLQWGNLILHSSPESSPSSFQVLLVLPMFIHHCVTDMDRMMYNKEFEEVLV